MATSTVIEAAGPRRERPPPQAGGRLYDAPVSEPHIRKVRPDELEEVWRVHVASSNDLLARRGRPAMRADDPVPSDARAGLASDPDGYFCAVEEGRIRGMVSALVRAAGLRRGAGSPRTAGAWRRGERIPQLDAGVEDDRV